MSKEAMKLALKKAFQLGQDYWYQADHESYRQNKKSDETLAKFRQLVDETCEALAKPDFWEGYVPEPVKPAPPECQTEAEKTAYAFGWWKALESQRALDKKAENARELGLDYEPAQQEPVATDWERIARVQDAKLRAMCNESGGFEKLCEVMDRYEHTSPQPAQQEPVATITITQRGPIRIIDNNFDDCVRGWPDGEYKLYTSPPAQRTWVGLSKEDKWEIVQATERDDRGYVMALVEAKLRSKNEDRN